MVYINEWLPNPAGSDAQNEWVELFNGGDALVSLSGWTLQAGTKKVSLSGTVGAGEYAVFKRTSTKLILRNMDETVVFYDARGNIADTSRFFGTAPEGKSFSRMGHGSGVTGQVFSWATPTPGEANKVELNAGITRDTYVAGVVLNPGFHGVEFVALLFGVAAVLAGLIFYAFKNHENLSKLFFKRNEISR